MDNEKIYLNLQEAVEKNKEDIKRLLEGGEHGVKGDKGDTGDRGPKGEKGDKGSGIVGVGTLPGPTGYKAGDVWISTDGRMYRHNGVSWLLKANLRGAMGPSGSNVEVIANPAIEPEEDLEAISIDGVSYSVGGGSVGKIYYLHRIVLFSGDAQGDIKLNLITSSQTYLSYQRLVTELTRLYGNGNPVIGACDIGFGEVHNPCCIRVIDGSIEFFDDNAGYIPVASVISDTIIEI